MCEPRGGMEKGYIIKTTNKFAHVVLKECPTIKKIKNEFAMHLKPFMGEYTWEVDNWWGYDWGEL